MTKNTNNNKDADDLKKSYDHYKSMFVNNGKLENPFKVVLAKQNKVIGKNEIKMLNDSLKQRMDRALNRDNNGKILPWGFDEQYYPDPISFNLDDTETVMEYLKGLQNFYGAGDNWNSAEYGHIQNKLIDDNMEEYQMAYETNDEVMIYQFEATYDAFNDIVYKIKHLIEDLELISRYAPENLDYGDDYSG